MTETEICVGEGALMSETFESAVCCSVLQCVAMCCSVLQCFADVRDILECTVLQCVAVFCSVLQCMSETFQSSLRADLIDRNLGSKRFTTMSRKRCET